MCYHYHFQKPVKEVAKILKIDGLKDSDSEIVPGVVNGFSHPPMPVIVNYQWEWKFWGLLPFWTKTEEEASERWNQTLNARWETIHDRPSFQKIRENRCVVPATGFYEWKQIGKMKIKHQILPRGHEFLFFAGMFDEWINPNTGEEIQTFTIITQPANQMMSEIHNTKMRMPVILKLEQVEVWFSQHYQEAVQPTSEDFLEATPEQSLLF